MNAVVSADRAFDHERRRSPAEESAAYLLLRLNRIGFWMCETANNCSSYVVSGQVPCSAGSYFNTRLSVKQPMKQRSLLL